MIPARAVGFAALGLTACGPAPAPASPPPAVTAARGSEGAEPAPSAPIAPVSGMSPLACGQALPSEPPAPAPAPAIESTPMAGQMTEEAAQAKRLFDGEHWDKAVLALERVANGDTGDDEGNKQLAAYYRAIALLRLGRSQDSAVAFLDLAAKPNHLKHAETLLWLVKLADAAPVAVRGFRHYDASHAARFDNEQQREVYQGAMFLLGRERFERGAKAEAAQLFAAVAPPSRYYPLARECLERSK